MVIREISTQSREFIEEATGFLRGDQIVAGPSDTIYGMFMRFSLQNAKSLHQIKKRDQRKPFLVILPEKENPLTLAEEIRDSEKSNFIIGKWPGKNTLVLRKKNGIPYPPESTIALRKPARLDNPWFYEVVNALGFPILAPSLNITGEEPMVDPGEVESVFSGSIAAFYYDPEWKNSIASRIYDLTGENIIPLR